MNLHSALKHTQQQLTAGNCSNVHQEARWIIEQLCQEFSLSSDTNLLPQSFLQRLNELIQRRQAGEPLQYVLGNTAFHCLELQVGPGVLIPRPETEILVEQALLLYPGQGMVCDLCTGSGAIALAMAKNLPQTSFVGSDLSEEALYWARKNQQLNGLHNVSFLQGDLFQPIAQEIRFSLLTANPPYVSTREYQELPGVVRDYEPELALLGGKEGLDLIARIIRLAPAHLLPKAWILLEIGAAQGAAVCELLTANQYANVHIRQDYAGKDRIAIAQTTV